MFLNSYDNGWLCVRVLFAGDIRTVELMCAHFTSLAMIGSGGQLVWAVNLIWEY